MVVYETEVFDDVLTDFKSLTIRQWYWCILVPLIDDLKTLCDVGVEAYNANRK